MRTAFANALFEVASSDPNVHLLVGDLGFGVLKRFMEELPGQFLNVGVAEQAMTGVAAGLALSGKTVLTYSIANFPVMRCLEQIRNDVCYHDADVKIVAVGGGLVYGALGASHFATEDIAVMRSLPNMVVVAPNDPLEASHAIRALLGRHGPAYLRLARDGEPTVHKEPLSFEIGQAILVRDGTDATVAVTGGLLKAALDAAELLARKGIGLRVLSFHTIKPLDEQSLVIAAKETSAVFTLEEHSIVGGFGSAVAEFLMESPAPPATFRRIGLPNRFPSRVGNQEYLRRSFGLDSVGIAGVIEGVLRQA